MAGRCERGVRSGRRDFQLPWSNPRKRRKRWRRIILLTLSRRLLITLSRRLLITLSCRLLVSLCRRLLIALGRLILVGLV